MNKTIFDYSVIHRLCKRYILAFANIKPNENVLDGGCGIGFITNEIAKKTKNAVGIDLNKESIEFAKKNMKGHYMIGNVEKTKFKKNYFDKIISSNVLEHLKNPGVMLKEFSRILIKGGKLILLVPCSNGILNGTWLNRIGHDANCNIEYHYRDGFKFFELKKILEDNKFRIIRRKYFNFLIPELITEISKFYSFKIKKIRYEGQFDIYSIKNSIIFNIYTLFFPFLYLVVLLEEMIFPKLFKGHGIIVEAIKI